MLRTLQELKTGYAAFFCKLRHTWLANKAKCGIHDTWAEPAAGKMSFLGTPAI